MNDHLRELWRDSWDDDIWIAPWSEALDGVSAEQAAWKPQPGRHSIWQLVNHVIYWRDVTLAQLAGAPPIDKLPPEEEQFASPEMVEQSAWDATRARLATSHRDIQTLLDDPDTPIDRLCYHLAHDAYHLGQICLLRGLQGLPPVA